VPRGGGAGPQRRGALSVEPPVRSAGEVGNVPRLKAGGPQHHPAGEDLLAMEYFWSAGSTHTLDPSALAYLFSPSLYM